MTEPTAIHTGPILLKHRNDCSLFQGDDGKLILECKHCWEAHVVEWGFEFGTNLIRDKARLEELWVKHCEEWHNV